MGRRPSFSRTCATKDSGLAGTGAKRSPAQPDHVESTRKLGSLAIFNRDTPRKSISLHSIKGIKGQYLIFDDTTVFNVRGSEGYYVRLSIS